MATSEIQLTLSEVRRRLVHGWLALALRGGAGKLVTLGAPVLLTRRVAPEAFGALAVLQLPLGLLTLLVANATGPVAMKLRVRSGCEGQFSHHVEQYDVLGLSLQERAADSQLQGIDLSGQTVLDVGCGTGALALKARQSDVSEAVCGDGSRLMLAQSKRELPIIHYAGTTPWTTVRGPGL